VRGAVDEEASAVDEAKMIMDLLFGRMGAARQAGGAPKQKTAATKEDPQAEPYATFRRMRALAKRADTGSYGRSFWDGYRTERDNRYTAKLFCKQGRFMAGFTDDYDKPVDFWGLYATYDGMSDAQLRTYFTWRTRLRAGTPEKIDHAYAMVYVNELVNNIRDATPARGIEELMDFWMGFRAFDPSLDFYMRVWVRDYFVMYRPPGEFAEYSRRFPVSSVLTEEVVERFLSGDYLNDLRLLELASSYKISTTPLCKRKDNALTKQCIYHVMGRLNRFFAQHGVDMLKLFFEPESENYYVPFNGCVYVAGPHEAGEVRLSRYETVLFNDKPLGAVGLGMHRHPSIAGYQKVVGYLLKTVEIKIREALHYRPLKPPVISKVKENFQKSEGYYYASIRSMEKWKQDAYALLKKKALTDEIEKAIYEFTHGGYVKVDERGYLCATRPVEIDLNRLDTIRREHEETARKLAVEEEGATVGAAMPKTDGAPRPVSLGTFDPVGGGVHGHVGGNPTVTGGPENAAFAGGDIPALLGALSVPERAYLAVLAGAGVSGALGEGRPLFGKGSAGRSAAAHFKGMPEELLAESINEKALDAIGDNVLYPKPDGPGYAIYEEYGDQLAALLDGM
jgi:hypothetical protein